MGERHFASMSDYWAVTGSKTVYFCNGKQVFFREGITV